MAKGTRRDRNSPYLAILLEKHWTGHAAVHAGLAKHGIGHPFCDDERALWEFAHPASDPRFALNQGNGWRHRYAEAYLELNRGCKTCLEILYQLGAEAGYSKPKSISVCATVSQTSGITSVTRIGVWITPR